MIEHFPFMLSLSKHSEALFSNLLRLFRTGCSKLSILILTPNNLTGI
jgi:hypothetical protein